MTTYIQWAVKEGFGVIDANVPHYITKPEDLEPFIPRSSEQSLSNQIKELMNYIWDNYLQLYDYDDLFLMGVGNAYLGVKLLLTERRKLTHILTSKMLRDSDLRLAQNVKNEFPGSSTL